ncbi:nicotinate-nucleotide--dimethylbenzimidazole phosphoribosyltransferase [Streptomyces sp. NPDC093221]|uniref:nicotinate-nucleotide--dimethylbenzimidazole phosphoribosyltransferase n=1 Tax=Streptomyces sp. NPDC093221 TaxID=3366032 RepID=UPI0038081253
MTDTGRIPGEGLPENAVGEAVRQPHSELPGTAVPQPSVPGWGAEPLPDEQGAPAYTYLDQPAAPGAGIDDEDDVLLMPGPQGSWSDPQPVPPQPVPAHADAHEAGGRDSGSIDYAAVLAPQPLPQGVAQDVQQAAQQGGEALPPAVPPVAEAATPGAGNPAPGYGFDTGTEHAAPAAEFAGPGDTGAVPMPSAGVPQPAGAQAAQTAAPRRPLHMGPPMPDSIGGGVSVRSLADRGPAHAQAPAQTPVRASGPPTSGPEYLDVPQDDTSGIPAQQTGEAADRTPASGTAGAEQVGGWPAAPAASQPSLIPHADSVVPPRPADPLRAFLAPDDAPEETAAPAAAPVAAVPAQAPAPVAVPEPAAQPEAVAVEPVRPVPPAQPAAAEYAPAPEQAAPAAPAEQEAPHVAPEEQPSAAVQAPAPLPEAVPVEAAPAEAAPVEAVPVEAVRQTPAEGTPAPAAAEPVAEPEPADVPEQAAAPAQSAETAPEATPEAEAAPVEAVPEAAPETVPEAVVAEPVAPEPVAPEPVAAAVAEAEEAQPLPVAVAPQQGPAAEAYEPAVRDAVHRVIRERRDIRNGFRSDPIPHDVLLRVLEAAHTAPSVGHSQPWDFVVIRSAKTREKMHELAMQQREAYAKSLPKGRARQFRELKIEAILDTPVNIVVTADPTRGGRHTLGRHTQPQMAPYSSALAVENLWLAARAEGLGVGWVSFFDERQMVTELGLPEHLEVVAYLCVGYVDEFPDEPELMQAGWSQRRPLSWVVHDEEYGNRALPGEEPHDLLEETLRGIRPLDAKALGEAWERQKRMTKPAGALGMLEIISAQLSGLSRQCPPPIPEPAAVAIFAGDHGVHAQGVTAWPQEVTAQMVANFLGGGAVCNAFANQVGAEVCVVDVGVASELPSTPGLLPRKVRAGTADFTAGPAMTREEALRAIEVGIETARDLVAAGNKALLTGEMGIANTTTSAALIAVYTGVDPAEVTGRGTGINDEMHARKVEVVRRALDLHRPDPGDPIGVLTAIGGLEHAAMVGLLLGAAALRTPVILDGVSAGAAALVARAIAPEVLAACIAGHRSAEPGHVAALTTLGLRPLVDLDLRLGEGTGALLALPLVQSAARVMHEVATFDAAGVTEKG